jgi:DNA modification methylase
MGPAFETPHVTVYQGDALAVLRELPSESVDCVVTSPPYWALRDYNVVGQIGLEKSPTAYVRTIVRVFHEVRRVLRKDGTLWLNMGDSYANQGGPGWQGKNGQRADRRFTAVRDSVPMRKIARRPPAGLKAKDLVGMPWRVAFALQADGWYLRSDIVWSKPNPMPESVTDRPTKAHEYVFLLAKSARYFYDAEAVRESSVGQNAHDIGGGGYLMTPPGQRPQVGNRRSKMPDGWDTGPGGHGTIHREGRENGAPAEIRYGRNARSVWEIATQAYPEAHFATFPEELPRRCIKAGCPEQVCGTCGKPRERVTEATYTNPGNRRSNGRRDGEGFRELGVRVMASGQRLEKQVETVGFTDCGHGAYRPGVVLDPFAGSGTTLAVARDLGRRSIGIELNPEYVALIERRCSQLALEMA